MARNLYYAANGATPTTAAQLAVATGTSIKTLLQIATPSTMNLTVIAWGISFAGTTASNAPIACELLQTDVAATTGTSLTPTIWGDPNGPASLCVGGGALTCFSPTGEGTITSTRVFDVQYISPTGGYVMQFPLGREPTVPVSKFLRVRVTAANSVNAYTWIAWEE